MVTTVRGEYEERGRSDLVKAIMGVLPIDPEDGTCVILVTPKCNLVWGDPRELAHRILDALDEAYTNRDMQMDHGYECAVENWGREDFF